MKSAVRSGAHSAPGLVARGRGSVLERRADYFVYGLRVRSEVELCGWPPAPPGEPQLRVALDPTSLPSWQGSRYNARTSIDGDQVQLEIFGVGRYTATGGTVVRVAPEPDAAPEDILLYLTGAMFGVILHQRGIVPLHASCVAMGRAGVAFAAPSGEGKSTLVGALVRRGARFITDDICVLTPPGEGRSLVWPGASRLKLDESGMATLDHSADGLTGAGGNRGKFHVPVALGGGVQEPVPLTHVYLLSSGDGPVRVEQLSGIEAVSALMEEVYLLQYASALGRSPDLFRAMAALARTLTVRRLIRPRGFERLPDVVDVVASDVGAQLRVNSPA